MLSKLSNIINILLLTIFIFISSSISTSTVVGSEEYNYNTNYLNDNNNNNNKFEIKNSGEDYEDTGNLISAEQNHQFNGLNLGKVEGTGESDKVNRIKRFPPHLEPNIMAMGSKFWIRTGECPRSVDGDKKFFCPFPNPNGRFACLEAWELCDGVKNCPDASDESPVICMFYKVLRNQMHQLFKSQKLQKAKAVTGTGTSTPEEYIADDDDEERLLEIAANKKSQGRNWLYY